MDRGKPALLSVKTGDWLVRNGPLQAKRAVKVRRTPSQIHAAGCKFDLDGGQIGGTHDYWLSLPHKGQIEQLHQAETAANEKVSEEKAKLRKEEQTPEYKAAEWLVDLGAFSADELLNNYDSKSVLRAAKILRDAAKKS